MTQSYTNKCTVLLSRDPLGQLQLEMQGPGLSVCVDVFGNACSIAAS